MIALLERSHGNDSGADSTTFETTDHLGLKHLGDSEQAAYRVRLEALSYIERRAARSGETDPAELVEWIVATAENPLTRGEAIGELRSLLFELDSHGEKVGMPAAAASDDIQLIVKRFRDEGGTLSSTPSDVVLAGFLTAEHEKRLAQALRSTQTLGQADRDLFQIVRRWDETTARAWLSGQFRQTKPNPEADEQQLWWLLGLGDSLDNDAMRALASMAIDRKEEIEAISPEDGTNETRLLRQQELAVLAQRLRRDFAELLAQPPRPPQK